MTLLPIVRLGHPALRQPAEPVDVERLDDPDFQQLIDDMFETMLDAHGVGLAAPQVGLSQQLFVYAAVDPDQPAEDGDSPELFALINPNLQPESGEMIYDWEGCLSISDLRGLVPRHPAIRVQGLDRHGQGVDVRVSGYVARIVQHEFDHLNGIIFLDRMRDLRSLAFADEWEEFMTSDQDDGPPVG